MRWKTPLAYKRRLAPTQHITATLLVRYPTTKMPGPIVHNETTAAELEGFVAILVNLTRRAFGMEEPPEYVVYQEHASDAIHYFWATVHIYGRSITSERPYQFTGRTTSDEPPAIQLVAQEDVVHLRHRSPRG